MFDHVGLRVKDLDASARLYAAMLAPLGHLPGAKSNGKPGLRADYGPTCYAAFLVDFDGNNVEAVCML